MAGLILCGSAAAVWADTITLVFHGTVDLTAFGGSASSIYEGRVGWDPATVSGVPGADWARYLLDGSPGGVTGSLSIDGVDYSDRIRPFSRFEQTRADLFLELYFDPVLDLDGGAMPDVERVALDLWTESPPAFDDPSHLPADLSAIRNLERHRIWFTGAPGNGVAASSDDVSVPEPASLVVVAAGVAAFSLRRRHARRRCSARSIKTTTAMLATSKVARTAVAFRASSYTSNGR
jgi:hypothetical protein